MSKSLAVWLSKSEVYLDYTLNSWCIRIRNVFPSFIKLSIKFTQFPQKWRFQKRLKNLWHKGYTVENKLWIEASWNPRWWVSSLYFFNVHSLYFFKCSYHDRIFKATINGNFNGGVYFNTTEHILNNHLCIYFYSETNGNKKFSV